MNDNYRLYQVTSCAYVKKDEAPTHDPPYDPPSRHAWVWSEKNQRWGLTQLQKNTDLDNITQWPNYQIGGENSAEDAGAAPEEANADEEKSVLSHVQNRRERKKKTKKGKSSNILWIVTLILVVLAAINNDNTSSTPMATPIGQILMQEDIFEPAPPLEETIPEGYVRPEPPANCTGEGVTWVPATLENQTYTIDPESSWVPMPGETYCIADPDLFWRAFMADSTLEDLKAFNIANDSSFRDGGSILRRYITAFSSKYRMSVRSNDKDGDFFKRWNQVWYTEFVNKIKAYLRSPSDDSKFVVTFPSEAPIDNIDMDRLVKGESLPIPPKITPTPFIPPVDNTPTPEPIYNPPTPTLMPTMMLEVVPTIQHVYPTATYAPNTETDLTWSDESVQNYCITAIGSVSFDQLYQQNFWNDGVTTRIEFRWEDDGYLHAYGNRVAVAGNPNGSSVCILQITNVPNTSNIDGKGSRWLAGQARLYAAYGKGDGTWNGAELKQNGLWLFPIEIGAGYAAPTPVPIPTPTPYPGNVTLAGYIDYLNSVSWYWTHSCSIVGTIGTMTQSSTCDAQRYVDFSEVWDLVDASQGTLIVGKCSSSLNNGSIKMSQYRDTIWCYGPVK